MYYVDNNSEQVRVCGLRMTLLSKDGEEGEEVVGRGEHSTLREEVHKLEEGEFITEVTTYHPKTDLQTGDTFRYHVLMHLYDSSPVFSCNRKEIHSLTNISDLSFTTNKGRTLGPR